MKHLKQVLLYPSYVFFHQNYIFYHLHNKTANSSLCLKITCILYVMPVIIQISESRLCYLKENGGMTHILSFCESYQMLCCSFVVDLTNFFSIACHLRISSLQHSRVSRTCRYKQTPALQNNN